MKRKLSWMCAAVIGLSAFPAFMTAAAPAMPPLINAEPTEPAQSLVTEAPVVAQTAPSREVKLTFAQIAPPPGSMALRGADRAFARGQADLCANRAAAGQYGAAWR
ncbi:TPA: hypothetical protein G7927_002686 [Salmonella enterica subsp. enterica serovar Typhi]|nr:hypothetical protein [Salmonella enterica subsp. enterica serovar Typhi]